MLCIAFPLQFILVPTGGFVLHFYLIFVFPCKVLSSGRQKWLQLLQSISTREEAVAGGVAMAAAFATYLGPYSFTFRREMLTVHWPRCLDERGVMLVMDSSAPYAGAEVFEIEKAQQAPTSGAEPAASEQEVPVGELDENANEDESRKQDDPNGNVLSSGLF